MADWVRDVNRIRELLASISPLLERAFDFSTRCTLILLTEFQTPDAWAPSARTECGRT
jgi:hypothetical protein